MTLPSSELHVPEMTAQMTFPSDVISTCDTFNYEQDRLKNTEELLSKEELDKGDSVSWAAYRASQSSLSTHKPAIISLLPMFMENAHSLAMIAHAMNMIRSAVHHVSPTQIPVVAVDQPLFALAKQIQWKLGNLYNEEQFVIMFGGLHIEMAAFKMLGKWLNGSGWTEALCNAGVATQGVADSFLTASHLTRTRRAHQVTAAALHMLMMKGYKEYTTNFEENEPAKSCHQWRKEMSEKCPQFLYWSRVLELQLCCLQLVRAFREANFSLYVTAIKQILPWMFAMDHPNYARWLSVHYRDMCELPVKHPEVYAQFCNNGSFVVHKTSRLFSSIALDHAHEQVNAVVKGEGGAVGLTENPAALRRWIVAGPELARMVKEFEGTISAADTHNHHEQKPGVQSAFAKDVLNVVSSFEELGNPFMEEGKELIAIHTKDVMDAAVVDTVQNAKELGEEQFQTFVKERFVERSKPITEPVKKNNLPTFKTQSKKVPTTKAKVAVLKEDCALFSRLFIACQSREGNLEDFFRFENQPWPPSLSQMGHLRGGQKADLVKCLPNTSAQTLEQLNLDAVILDEAVIVQMLQPRTAQSFEEYFNTVFAPYILRQLDSVKRVDLVWDVYRADTLKRSAREKRGTGQRRKVLPSTRIPSDWKGFLRVDENKDELFKFLGNKVIRKTPTTNVSLIIVIDIVY